MPEYVTKPNVVLKPKAKEFVAAIAKDFDKTLVVTSGYRGPERQAMAMYGKFKSGGSYRIYRQTMAARDVYEAYSEGIKGSQSKTKIIKSMAAVLVSPISQASCHLIISEDTHAQIPRRT